MKPCTVLVAVMDWGLGHAARSIPIVHELLSQRCTVVIAGSGDSLNLMRTEFPSLSFVPLSSYAPVYPTSSSLVLKLCLQLPKFIKTIQEEHRQTAQVVKNLGINLVISDNRYGCWSRNVKSVFITHQVNLMLPPMFNWARGAGNYFHRNQIRNFDKCWVPDWPGKKSLAGMLSKTDKIPVRYIGPLTRFATGEQHDKKYDLLILLSGPEPQRTILEKKILPQCSALNKNICLVRGTKERQQAEVLQNIETVNLADTVMMGRLLQSSELVIARSGYSTIMDLACVGGKAIFVPTPGQTEQGYLATKLEKEGIAFYMRQDEWDVNVAIKEADRYIGFPGMTMDSELLKAALDEVMPEGGYT